MIKLGSRVKDTLTGFKGIATGRTEWLYGCARIGVEAETTKEKKPGDTFWFDEQRVEVIKEMGPRVSKNNSATSGGPQADPKR